MINLGVTDEMKSHYTSGDPFPHIIIDNFFNKEVLNKVAEEFNSYYHWGYDDNSEKNQIKKYFSPWCEENIKDIPPYTKATLDYLNSDNFIKWLENLTGIKDLIPDNTWTGAGMHMIKRGGKLSVHADSNCHAITGNYRRINLLIYLNENWMTHWGGGLQLWKKDMSSYTADIDPIFNRAVIFNTTDDAFHGHPDPLNCPEDISRNSLALYYYTEDRPEEEKSGITYAVWKETQPKKMDRPTIVFASMCKNEEHCIKNTLESVYRFIDYWVICDTGSTDQTCNIIRDFFEEKGIPGELYVDEWQGFDKNKTLMMERAYGKGDYIMHLDADDLLVGDLVFPTDDAGWDCYYAPVKRGGAEWKALIFFNGRQHWKFCGVAHTIIKSLDKPNGYNTGDLSMYGFYISGEGIGSRSFDPKKYFYDAEKLQKQFFDTLDEDPDGLNNRSVFYTAQSYMDCGMNEEAVKWNRLYLKIKDTWIEERFEAQMRIARLYLRMEKPIDLAEVEMKKAIDIFSDRAEPYFYLGLHHNWKGNWELGYQYLKAARSKSLQDVKSKYILFVNEGCYGKRVNDELSVACFWTNRFQEGIDLINDIIDDPAFAHSRERIQNNLNLCKAKLGTV
jgi:Rps23 Pro-64 3,4-dihydroxylase Tpa1-like proline 4-hydroxylase/glycosyltransferase involved in cell wall biosynthesis